MNIRVHNILLCPVSFYLNLDTNYKRISPCCRQEIFFHSGLLDLSEDHTSAIQSYTNPYHCIYGGDGDREGLRTASTNLCKAGTKSLWCASKTITRFEEIKTRKCTVSIFHWRWFSLDFVNLIQAREIWKEAAAIEENASVSGERFSWLIDLWELRPPWFILILTR